MTISSAEEYLFQDELYTFVRCKLFFDHISELMDTNGDASISFDEWTSFFQICENELTSGTAIIHALDLTSYKPSRIKVYVV